MVRRGEVRLDDSVDQYLPSSLRIPERGGRKISLLDLATHTSGLPGLPANIHPKNMSNPYADYTEDMNRTIVWHGGGTGGYRALIAFDPGKQIGVVVLTNFASGADEIGFHLLDPTLPLH